MYIYHLCFILISDKTVNTFDWLRNFAPQYARKSIAFYLSYT